MSLHHNIFPLASPTTPYPYSFTPAPVVPTDGHVQGLRALPSPPPGGRRICGVSGEQGHALFEGMGKEGALCHGTPRQYALPVWTITHAACFCTLAAGDVTKSQQYYCSSGVGSVRCAIGGSAMCRALGMLFANSITLEQCYVLDMWNEDGMQGGSGPTTSTLT